MTNSFDYYAILGVEKGATVEEIRLAFTALRTQLPEAERDPVTNPAYQRLLNAYEVLTDRERRKTYDSLLVDTTPSSLTLSLHVSRTQLSLSENPQLIYLLLEATSPIQNRSMQQPLNLCLVIDRSTSMKGERLKHVKTAVELIIEKLSSNDILSIVSFSDRATVVVPAEPVTNKLLISSKARGIMPSGGTEIFQGLNAGYQEIQKRPLDQYTNHLILLTDGHTYGDSEHCLELAQRAADKSIGISAFGIGSEWNDTFLDDLVTPSGGQSGFIEQPEEIVKFLQKRIKGLGELFAKNVRLNNQFPEAIQVRQAFKLHPFAQPISIQSDELHVGDIEARAPLSLLLELAVKPQTVETRINLNLILKANILTERGEERTFKEHVQLLILSQAEHQRPPDSIVQAVRMLSMHTLNEKVQEELAAGHLDVATTRMRYLSTRLLEVGETELAQQANTEANRLENAGEISAEGQKRLKYGTRALISQNNTVEDDD